MKKVWNIAADASLQSVVDSPECPPLLRRTLTGVLSWQVRNETPVRRALTSSRVAPWWVAALLALGATLTVEGDDGPMEMPLVEAGKGDIRTLHVRVGGLRWGEAHVARTPADEAIVAAVAAVEMDGDVVRQARVALTGVWQEPVRLAQAPARLAGGPLDEDSIGETVKAVEKEVKPEEDFLGSEEYRRAMAGVLTRRALEACLRREVADE